MIINMILLLLGAKLVRGRNCGGRVGQGPGWLGAEFVRGRDVQLPSCLIIYVISVFVFFAMISCISVC